MQYHSHCPCKGARSNFCGRSAPPPSANPGLPSNHCHGKGDAAVEAILKVQPLKISMFHPQTNGLVECVNGTLKWMRTNLPFPTTQVVSRLPYLLFAFQEVLKSFPGHSHFEWLNGKHLGEILDVLWRIKRGQNSSA